MNDDKLDCGDYPSHEKEVVSQDEARQIAMDWLNWLSYNSLSYGEIAEQQGYFRELATKFDLMAEFKENGVI